TQIDTDTPEYDEDGNLTSQGNWTYTWNGENRLIEATDGVNTLTFEYDFQGRLIKKTENNQTEIYLYDGWNRIATYSGGVVLTDYLWGLDLSGSPQGAGGVGGLLREGNLYPLYDANGNIMQKLDDSGAVQMSVVYDPFGNIIDGTLAGEYGFSTKPLIGELNWYYYGFRYYDPETGRWPNRDPIEEMGGLNLYGFVGNNTLSGVDNLGLVTIDIPLFPPVEVPIPRFPPLPDPRNWRRPQLPTIRLPRIPRLSPPSQICVVQELYSGYRQMREANTIGADNWFHCMAMCRAARNCGNPEFTDTMGIMRELTDLIKMRFRTPTHPDGTPFTHIEQAEDSIEDMLANRTGIHCPSSETCECCCEQYLPPGLDPNRWMN
ncbi:MAG: hypothetical protein JJU05_19475, partial [Verrucomicrobia bacterium]|nr:hypothetical protein [Verrucomicrobiota bacterium]